MHAPPPDPDRTITFQASAPEKTTITAPGTPKLNRHQRRVLAAVQRSPAKMKKWKAVEASLPAEETPEVDPVPAEPAP